MTAADTSSARRCRTSPFRDLRTSAETIGVQVRQSLKKVALGSSHLELESSLGVLRIVLKPLLPAASDDEGPFLLLNCRRRVLGSLIDHDCVGARVHGNATVC